MSAFSRKTNRRVVPPGCCTTNAGQTFVSPSGYLLSPSPAIVQAFKSDAPKSTQADSTVAQNGIGHIAMSNYGNLVTGNISVQNNLGQLAITFSGGTTLVLGDVIRVPQLNRDIVVNYRSGNEFVGFSFPYTTGVVSPFSYYKAVSSVQDISDEQFNVGRRGGLRQEDKVLRRIPVADNKASSIRQGKYNEVSGVYQQSINYTTQVASGVKGADTVTGGNYQRLGSGFIELHNAKPESITTYQVSKKT